MSIVSAGGNVPVNELEATCRELAERAKAASRKLATARGEAKNEWLSRSAQGLRRRVGELIEANMRDLEAAPGYGLNAAAIDRLTLNTGPPRAGDMMSSHGLIERPSERSCLPVSIKKTGR